MNPLSNKGKCLLRIFAAFLLVFGASLARAQSYAVSNLVPFNAAAINNAGTVVGYTEKITSVNVPLGTDETFTYRAVSYSGGIMTDLGSLGGAYSNGGVSAGTNTEFFTYYGQAAAINNLGTIVGLAGTSVGTEHAFSYSNGTMTDLGTLSGRTASQAKGINDAGTIVGSSSSEESTHAFSYGNGIITDLGTLYPGDIVSQANAINDAGTIVGNSGQRAFSYSNGTMSDLGTLRPGGFYCQANAINDAGTIVGVSDGRAFSYANGAFADLGYLDENYPDSAAYAINNSGTIVGSSYVQTGGPQFFADIQHAFLYRNGTMTDLNSLVSLPGVTLSVASGINDHGQIVCSGDDYNSYLLTPIGPAFFVQPKSVMLAAGQTASFFVGATGVGPFSYRWNLNGAPISGATDQYLLVSNVSAANAGAYNCVVTDAKGNSSPSLGGALSVASTTNIGRLINFSALGQLGKSEILTIGFFTGGAGTTGSQPMLVQAIGPTLSTVGVTGIMPDPQLNAFSNQNVIAANTGWGTPLSNQLAVTAADAATYATALANPTSKDSAIVMPLAPGGYTVQVNSVSGVTGTALAALYDDTPSGTYAATTPRLINLSCRLQVASNSSLTAGFWIGGTTAKTVLIRADGPALLAQNVTGVMPDPQLTVFNSADTAIAYNTGWGGSPVLFSVAASVYAQPFTSTTSNDSEVLMTLPPGGYTAQVSSASNTTGNVMIEVYEIP